MEIERLTRLLEEALSSRPNDGWYTCFDSLGIGSEGVLFTTAHTLGLAESSDTLLYVKDRERFLAAVAEIHGADAVAAALLALEEA